MTLGYIWAILVAEHVVLSAASTISVDPVSTSVEAADALTGAAGMLRRSQPAGQEVDVEPESLVQEGAGSEWSSAYDVPVSKHFSFAEYGQRYREAAGLVERKTPADALSDEHKKELRFFVRSLLEQAEDFEAQNILNNTRDGSAQVPGVPAWFHGGVAPAKNTLHFEYQCAHGRDGFECNPTEPASEYFGPFKIDYAAHTIYLQDWNLAIGTKLKRFGMGNLIVGLNQTYTMARNGLIVGKSNILDGSYGVVAGDENIAKAPRGAVVDGGFENAAAAEFANVNGGQKNNVTTHFAVAEAGFGNMASAPFSAVGGGDNNVADGFSADAMGGARNEALANLSAITGGAQNIIPPGAVSETVQGGVSGNVPTPEPPKALVIEPGEYRKKKASSTRELNYAALGCTQSDCEQEEEEEEEDEEEDNPATKRRTIDVEPVLEGGDSRRRTPHEDIDEDMSIKAPPE